MDEILKSIETYIRKIVAEEVADKVEEALNSHDFEEIIKKTVKDYDFGEEVKEVVRNMEFTVSVGRW